MASGANFPPRRDQPLVDRIELVGMRGNDAALDRLLEPGPLKHRRLEQRGRGVRIIFQQFCRTAPVETEIEPAIEAWLVAMPALGDQRPERLRHLQPAQGGFVVDRLADQFKAHRIDFAGWCFDLAFDLVQAEGITGALVPVALAVDGVEIKPGLLGGCAPVVALGAGEALHRVSASRHRACGRVRGTDAACRRSRHRYAAATGDGPAVRAGNDRPGRVRDGQSSRAARSPSIPRRRRRYPSWSRRHGANVSWWPLR